MPKIKYLQYPYTYFENYKGNGPMCISWFISGQKKPVAQYSKLICSSLNLSSPQEIELQQKAVNEFFTSKETDQLDQYLSSHKDFSLGKFSV